jgi:ABC-type uncharacterized transport system auxiliary subunit
MRLFKKIMAAFLLAGILSGCSTGDLLKSTEPPQTIYSLRPIESTGEPSQVLAHVLEISAPSVPPGMEQDRIALYLDDGQKLDYYAGARWSSSLEHIVQEFTRRSASAALPYIVAVTPDQGIEADYRLQIKINEFQPVYTAGSNDVPLLKANIEFTLIRLPVDQIVSSFTLSRQEAASENRLDIITLGLENLLQEIEHEAFIKIDQKLQAK